MHCIYQELLHICRECIKCYGTSQREVRALGVGLPYALTVAIFGGSAEYVALYLKKIGHEDWYFWFVSACACISFLVYFNMAETRDNSMIDKDC